jgi:XTP/dITP diphosphohydrolase
MRAVLATNNRGKLKELEAILAPLDFELVCLEDLGLDSPDETGLTFVENALIKARAAAAKSHLPAFADDSGLVVPALGGAPGIYSARYAGPNASDADNNAKLVAELANQSDRAAFFYCAAVFLTDAADPTPLFATARWRGRVIDAPRGDRGFGYDPHFLVDGLDATAAELEQDAKNKISHRGQAMARLVATLDAR